MDDTSSVTNVTLGKIPRPLIRKLEDRMSPLRVLEAIAELRRYLERLEDQALRDARSAGLSPTDMADALRITRQGLYEKLKRLERRPPQRSAPAADHVTIPELVPAPTEPPA